MTNTIFIGLLLVFVYGGSVASLQCFQGFNLTIAGVPFTHWSQGDCREDSVCFLQEITVRYPHPEIRTRGRYGGCVEASYSNFLTCDDLFGEDSVLDPAILFNMLPGLGAMIGEVQDQFQNNIAKAYHSLLSNGTGLESFVEGCYTMLDNLGLNTDYGRPLKKDFVKLLNVSLPRPPYWKDNDTLAGGIPQSEVDEVAKNFLKRLRTAVDLYEEEYPNSEFPKILWRTAQYFNRSYYLPTTSSCYYGHYAFNFDMDLIRKCEESRKEAESNLNTFGVDILVDLQFAIVNELDVQEWNLFEEILKAFPEYEFFVRLLRLLDPADVREIYKVFPKYLVSAGKTQKEGYLKAFVSTFNETVTRMTLKFGEFNSELRRRFSPETCKYRRCQSDLCNSEHSLNAFNRKRRIHRNTPKPEALMHTRISSSSASYPSKPLIATTVFFFIQFARCP